MREPAEGISGPSWWRRRIRAGVGHAVDVESVTVHRRFSRSPAVLVLLSTTHGPREHPTTLLHQYRLTAAQAQSLAAQLTRAVGT